MNNSVLLEVHDGLGNLLHDLADPLLREYVLSFLQVVIKVFTFDVLENNKVVALIFKVVN